jgi:hypothetical protein
VISCISGVDIVAVKFDKPAPTEGNSTPSGGFMSKFEGFFLGFHSRVGSPELERFGGLFSRFLSLCMMN